MMKENVALRKSKEIAHDICLVIMKAIELNYILLKDIANRSKRII